MSKLPLGSERRLSCVTHLNVDAVVSCLHQSHLGFLEVFLVCNLGLDPPNGRAWVMHTCDSSRLETEESGVETSLGHKVSQSAVKLVALIHMFLFTKRH